ncbi:MAG TPA: M48 family metallopeptidase [Chthonomonadaceae bacterium]|nr:M48 family metallopeptidase [Chthonomonadaceae bacterium]
MLNRDKFTRFSRSRWRWGLCLLLALLAVGLAGCRTKSFLSTQDEIRLGQEAARQVNTENPIETGTTASTRVRSIGRSLLPHMADARDVPYSFQVIDKDTVNAFSLPGGPVYVYQGLLNMVGGDDSALACILGHELGHINARHAARQISSQMATNTLLDLAIHNPTGRSLAGLGAQLASLKYSRDDEYEADARGLSYAAAAGYDPNGLIRFFHKLQDYERSHGGNAPEWLQDHPLTGNRIERAESIIEHHDFRYGK